MSSHATLFQLINVPAVQAVLGSNPTRFFHFGQAPKGTAYPYAVWQFISGAPENYLCGAPDVQRQTVQIDVYAAESQGTAPALAAAQQLLLALVEHGYVTALRGHGQDPDTKAWRVGMDFDRFTPM